MSAPQTSSFVVREIDEGVEQFHHRTFGGEGRQLWRPTLNAAPTLVLGSRQGPNVADSDALAAAGVELCSRRSGGGAVLVSQDDLVWLDLVLDDDDPLWTNDVRRSTDWLGTGLRLALEKLGQVGAVHRGAVENSTWSDLVCFAGLGPGEVTINGRKVVGVSQRRTRGAARFQIAILRRWEPEFLVGLLALSGQDRARAAGDLADRAQGLTQSPDDIVLAIAESLNEVAAG